MALNTTDSGCSRGVLVSAIDVAAALRERHRGLPVVKLHKLLYYCQGHHLATFGRPLFRETVSAFDMGPVVGQLWYAEKNAEPGTGDPERLDEAGLNTVGYVLSRYGALSGRDLIRLTHNEDPWLRADAMREPQGRSTIEQEWMEQYFGSDEGDEESGPVLDPDDVAEWLRATTTRDITESREPRPGDRDDLTGFAVRLAALRSGIRPGG